MAHDHILRRLSESEQYGRAKEKVEKALKLLQQSADDLPSDAAGAIGSARRDIEEALRVVG